MPCKVSVELYLVKQLTQLIGDSHSLFPHMCEELPATIGNLQSLTVLNVTFNRLSGKCLVAPVRLLD
jgi:hypothetical protein